MHSGELGRAETPKKICCTLSSVQETERFFLKLTGASEAGARVLVSRVKGLVGAMSPAWGFKEGWASSVCRPGRQLRRRCRDRRGAGERLEAKRPG